MACRLFGAKSLSKPMGYCQLDTSVNKLQWNFSQKSNFSFKKIHFKMSAKWRPFWKRNPGKQQQIEQSNKSHNVPVPYPTMHHSEQKCVHFCFDLCIVGYGTGALWDLWYCVNWFHGNRSELKKNSWNRTSIQSPVRRNKVHQPINSSRLSDVYTRQ